MKTILILEDDKALSQGIILALKGEKLFFEHAFSIVQARQRLAQKNVDLMILDINLPDGNGLDFLKEIRQFSMMPIIMLTANDMETDIVTGLEMGADDYITKPFSLMVLRARVHAQLRKTGESAQVFELDNFFFDFKAMFFKKGEEALELSKTEQKLLRLLVENQGRVLNRGDLIDKIWTDGAKYVDENALSVSIKRLRDKLEIIPSKPEYIKTVYGIGYTWLRKKK